MNVTQRRREEKSNRISRTSERQILDFFVLSASLREIHSRSQPTKSALKNAFAAAFDDGSVRHHDALEIPIGNLLNLGASFGGFEARRESKPAPDGSVWRRALRPRARPKVGPKDCRGAAR